MEAKPISRRRWRSWYLLGLAIVLMPVFGLTGAGLWAYWVAPDRLERFGKEHPPGGLSLDALPKGFVDDLLAVEDPGFYTHHGIDLSTPGAGFTTLTQGLVKRIFYSDFEPGFLRWRKLEQSAFAIGFDARIPKAEQLRLFVNTVYLGTVAQREVLGFDNAAREYYGKSLAELSRDERLTLIAMVLGPDGYSVRAAPELNAERVARIRRLLAGQCRPRDFRDVEYEDCATNRGKTE